MIKIILFYLYIIVSVAIADEKPVQHNTTMDDNNIVNNDINNSVNTALDNYFTRQKSLLSTENEINLLNKVVAIYKKNSAMSNEELEQSTINTDIMYDSYNYQTFILYLKSILFLSKDKWSVWLNNKKITNADNKNKNEFFIKDIDDKKIVLQWNISEFKWGYVNKMNNISHQRFKKLENGSIELTLVLYSNQSYLPFVDQVVEGKYQYKKEEIKVENKSDSNDVDVDLESLINSL